VDNAATPVRQKFQRLLRRTERTFSVTNIQRDSSTTPKSSTSIAFEVARFTIILNKDAMPQTQFDINNIV